MNYDQKLTEILSSISPALFEMQESEASHKENPDRWSFKEILGHLIDSAYNNHQRFLRAEKQGNLIFPGYEQVDWVIKNDYQNKELEDVVNLFLQVNFHLADLIKGLPEELLGKKTLEHSFDKICMNRIDSGEESSLSYLIWDYLFHLEHHIKQIYPDYFPIAGSYDGN